MATSNNRSDLLPALTSFLTLAPTTSACYPTHRRTNSLPPVESSNISNPKSSADTSTAAVIPEDAAVDAAPAASVIPTNVGAELELKLRRSSSMGSDASDGSVKRFRFLVLGPVHHGEQLGGDWSEEVTIVE